MPDIVNDIPIRALEQIVKVKQSHALSNYPISETSGVKYEINGATNAMQPPAKKTIANTYK